MNFFKEQELARERLGIFRRFFYLTVLLTALGTAVALFYLPGLYFTSLQSPFGTQEFWTSEAFWGIFAGTLLFVFAMSEVKLWQLRRGGDYIARLAGGEPLPVRITDLKQQRLKNVVEEMSIAAGIVPPKIFVMPREPYINAFAAGFSTNNAVIGISQGCLDKLTREELQGVVAHELGHIVNGDMKLNLQLIGYLFGLMGISEVGRFIMRATSRSSSAGRNKKGGNPLPLLGLALFIVGIVGYFLGLLLKLKISRGQEFGADARAVQFTRNPEGIGGALKKIFALSHEFKINAPKAHQLEHMYLFYPAKWLDIFSTHPPLEDRIKKILPSFRLSEYRLREEKEHRLIMQRDLSDLVTKSFSAVPQMAKADTEAEERGELKNRALAFMGAIGGEGKLTDSQLLIREMDILLGRLRSLDEEELLTLIQQMKSVILQDHVILPREVLCYTLFKEVLLPKKRIPKSNLGLQKARPKLRILLSFLAHVSTGTKEGRRVALELGMKKLFPEEKIDLLESVSVNEIISALEVLRELVPKAQAHFLDAARIVALHDKKIDFNEEVFLKLLCQIMGVPVEI